MVGRGQCQLQVGRRELLCGSMGRVPGRVPSELGVGMRVLVVRWRYGKGSV